MPKDTKDTRNTKDTNDTNDTNLDELKNFLIEKSTVLKNVISDTSKLDTEFGMSICKDYRLKFSQKCQGDRCSVYPTPCDKEAGEETIAKFHTHLNQNRLSNQDKAVGIKYNERINCLGYETKDDVNKVPTAPHVNHYHLDCYKYPYGLSENQQKDIIDTDKKMASVDYKMIHIDQYSEEFEKLKNEKHKLFRQRFNAAESNIEPFLRIKL